MIRLLFRDEINMAISGAMFISGIVVTTGRISVEFGLPGWGASEPIGIFVMSSLALLYAGYGNVLLAVKARGNSNLKANADDAPTEPSERP